MVTVLPLDGFAVDTRVAGTAGGSGNGRSIRLSGSLRPFDNLIVMAHRTFFVIFLSRFTVFLYVIIFMAGRAPSMAVPAKVIYPGIGDGTNTLLFLAPIQVLQKLLRFTEIIGLLFTHKSVTGVTIPDIVIG